LTVAAGTVEIAGTIGRSVRAAVGEITVRGRITGDLVVLAGSVTVTNRASIGGDVILGGGTAKIQGQVGGDVRGRAGELDIAGRVGGDVHVEAETVRLRSGARIGGDFRYTSRNAAQIEDGATISGTTRHTEPQRFYPGDNLAAWISSAIFRLLCALLAGAAVVMLMPGTAAAIADGIRQAPLWSFFTGIVLAVVIPIFIVVLLVTVVGIPLALIMLALYLIILYLSQVFLGLALGRVILPSRWDTASRGYNLLAMVLGVLIVAGLRLLPVPYISGLIAALTAVLGLGAVVVGLRRTRRAPAIPASRF
jgi:cytoskeletal protein CcmA (bactofilin family)